MRTRSATFTACRVIGDARDFSALFKNLHSIHGRDAVSHLSTAAAYFCVKQKYGSEGYTDVPLRQVERRKTLGTFFFYQDARKSCALLGFARSCPEGDLNPFGYVLPIRPLRDACARFRRRPCRLFLAPARRSLRPSSPEYFFDCN